MITRDRLIEVFDYKDDGSLIWKVRLSPTGSVGKVAGTPSTDGYLKIGLDKRTYRAHRLVWIWHGNSPAETIDHINGDKLDNRIENLRAASKSQNGMNTKPRGLSGFKGVTKVGGKWQAQIKAAGRKEYLGLFHTKEEAALAYNNAAIEAFGEFAFLNPIGEHP